MYSFDVSVIVVNYNCNTTLKACIESILLSKEVGELLLVDNASTDDSLSLIKKCTDARLKILTLNRNIGLPAARNLAASKTKSRFIAFTDADSVVHPDWLQDPCSLLEKHSEIGAVQCKILSFRNPETISNVGIGLNDLGYYWGMPKESLNSYRHILFPIGAGFVIRRDAWNLVKGFDSFFFVGYDDIDLGVRLWLSGYAVMCSYKGIVYHDGGHLRKRRGIAPIFQFYSMRNMLYLWAKNLQGRTLAKQMIPFSLLIPFMAFWRFRVAGLMGVTSFLTRAPLTITKRYEVQRLRKIPDKQIVQMLHRSGELPVQIFADSFRELQKHIFRGSSKRGKL